VLETVSGQGSVDLRAALMAPLKVDPMADQTVQQLVAQMALQSVVQMAPR